MMTTSLKGRGLEEAEAAFDRFHRMLTDGPPWDPSRVSEAARLQLGLL